MNKVMLPNQIRCLLSVLIFFNFTIQAVASDNLRYVNLFIGTAGDNGQVDPGAAVPYGMIRVCPDSDPRSHSGYDFDVAKISGFSINRLSGVGCSGAGGNISIRPSGASDTLLIDKETEEASPGYYAAKLSNGVKAELTATHNTAIQRFYYPSKQESVFTVDFKSVFTNLIDIHYDVISPSEVVGYIKAANTCNRGAYQLYFSLVINQDCSIVSEKDGKVEFSCNPKNNDNLPLEIRIAVSPIDIETARSENKQWRSYDFDAIADRAKSLWKEKLSKIDVEGNEYDKTLFYTSLYRVFLSPANTTSWDRKYLATDGSVRPADSFVHYGSWSIWDTYRTKFPLITLLDPDAMSDFCNSLTKLYVYGKEDWSTNYEPTPSVRTEHTSILLLDAYLKGISNIDLHEAYDGLKTEMKQLKMKSPDQKIEACNDLWAMSQLAYLSGHEDEYLYYKKLSENLFSETWNQEFKNIDSTYTLMKNNGLYQGTRWQYRWASPQYLDKMIEAVGNKEILSNQLDQFFEKNLYNQGNEPDIHVPFLFNRLGYPYKAQSIVNQLLSQDMYHLYGGNAEYPVPYYGKAFKLSPKGYMPEMDEDDGTMSAWYVFASIGLYPLVVGEPFYELTMPAFDHITLHLDNGKTFVINRTIKDENNKICDVTLNGKAIVDFRISHQEILAGGKLDFTN